MKNNSSKKVFQRVGERMHYVREVERVTLEELSKNSGLSIERLEKWEKGDSSELPATDMCLIADSLDVSVGYLFSFEIEESIKESYLSYRLSMLPEDIQDQLIKVLEEYNNEDIDSTDFENKIANAVANGDSDMRGKIKAKILELADEL